MNPCQYILIHGILEFDLAEAATEDDGAMGLRRVRSAAQPVAGLASNLDYSFVRLPEPWWQSGWQPTVSLYIGQHGCYVRVHTYIHTYIRQRSRPRPFYRLPLPATGRRSLQLCRHVRGTTFNLTPHMWYVRMYVGREVLLQVTRAARHTATVTVEWAATHIPSYQIEIAEGLGYEACNG